MNVAGVCPKGYGHINIKKAEPQLNTFSRVLTYFSRSNTDVTSLLSGTAVKAVVSYVSDYVSKLGLKSYQAFASVFDVFERNQETSTNGAQGVDTAKTLMRQMINSMSTKMEIGSPMASMYVLGNPDHYCSHKYVNFAWRSYVTFVKNYWHKGITNDDEGEDIAEDLLTIQNQNGSYVACSIVDDNRFRPVAYEHVNLYEWVQCSEKKARSRKECREFEETVKIQHELDGVEENEEGIGLDRDVEPDYDADNDLDDFIDDDLADSDISTENNSDSDGESDWNSEDEDAIIVEKENQKLKADRITRHSFLPAHKAAFMTHAVHCDFQKLDKIIPNFMGGAIPRADKGDREYYCMTMMPLFKPWRSPADLKDAESNWD
ncbi:hypothetical protein B0H13DRAFT_1935544 [Mycena leptocephala]|nr:hypothetical protein B0H13DRAFT_1935544 [Mycena leptocephala]